MIKVLVACEVSGVVRDAFIKQGYDAMSCDILPTDRPGPHFQGNVLEILNDGWDLMIAHPPCTRLCNSGVSWLEKRGLWDEMEEACEFFKSLLDAPIPRKAVENPILHGYALEKIGCNYDQIIQPWCFGHSESKSTCLWLRNLPKLKPTNVLRKSTGECWDNQTPSGQNKLGPSDERAKIRSTTYQGVADAMAEQWGNFTGQIVRKSSRKLF